MRTNLHFALLDSQAYIYDDSHLLSDTDSHSKIKLSPNPITAFIDEATFEGASMQLQWINTTDSTQLIKLDSEVVGLGNVSRINNIRRINKFLEKANQCMSDGQILVIKMETKKARREHLFSRFPSFVAYPIHFLDFVFNRVIPKIKLFQKPYFHLTKGKNRPLSLAEGLGRLVSCGFSIIDYQEIDETVYIVSRKVKKPVYDMDPSYSMFIRLKRIGQHGKIIRVRKIRTMHPYSEYLQDYLYKQNQLEKRGKIKNDFRMTEWGKVFRRYWIDELPMFWNFFKGELKLVGVRPLSPQYYSLYPTDLQELRIQFKPGLIPPFYADLPTELDQIHESEREYLKRYKVNPLRTDLNYFIRAVWNILFGGARSG